MAIQISRIGPIARVSEGIKVDHVMTAFNDQAANKMRADEPGTAGDENFHVIEEWETGTAINWCVLLSLNERKRQDGTG
jgi:hypothetical protein